MTDLRELFISDSTIKKSLKQLLYKIPPAWESFPDYAKEIFYLISVMPHQAFEFPDNIALQSINYIERKTSDEKLRIEWIVNCRFDQDASPKVAELFYKIETLVIRPLIRKQGSDVKACFPIGTLEEIANTINFDGESLNDIEDAISFGSSINIELRISEVQQERRKVKGKSNTKVKTKPSSSSMSFTPFQWRISTTDFTEEDEPVGNIFGEKMCYLFPSCSYVDVLHTSLQIEKIDNLRQFSPLALRMLEIFYWKALIDEHGKQTYAENTPQFGVSKEEVRELFPLTDESKFEELIKEFEVFQNDLG